jgi:hypothetical protein
MRGLRPESFRAIVTGLVAAGLLAACASGPGASGGPTTQPTGAAATGSGSIPPATTGPGASGKSANILCTLLTDAEIAAAVGVALTAATPSLTKPVSTLPDPQSDCSYGSRERPVNLYVRALEPSRFPSASSQYVAVSGIGEKAAYLPGGGSTNSNVTIYVVKGQVCLTINLLGRGEKIANDVQVVQDLAVKAVARLP